MIVSVVPIFLKALTLTIRVDTEISQKPTLKKVPLWNGSHLIKYLFSLIFLQGQRFSYNSRIRVDPPFQIWLSLSYRASAALPTGRVVYWWRLPERTWESGTQWACSECFLDSCISWYEHWCFRWYWWITDECAHSNSLWGYKGKNMLWLRSI